MFNVQCFHSCSLMQRLLAITWLTWKAALRFKLFLVIAALLLASVIGLPILIKDDGTARGFTQILLTYTLSTITAPWSCSWIFMGASVVCCQRSVVNSSDLRTVVEATRLTTDN